MKTVAIVGSPRKGLFRDFSFQNNGTKVTGGHFTIGFINDNSLVAINPQGKYFRINLELNKKGEYKVIENKQILNVE